MATVIEVTQGGTGVQSVSALKKLLELGPASQLTVSNNYNDSSPDSIVSSFVLSEALADLRKEITNQIKESMGLEEGETVIPITKGGTGADTAALACENLGAVKKSGDTMTGPLVLKNSNDSSTQSLSIANANGKPTTIVNSSYGADGSTESNFISRTYNSDGTFTDAKITLRSNSDGTTDISIPTPSPSAGGNQIATIENVTNQIKNGTSAAANKLATARTIAISGGATGTATSFDGSANITIPVTGLDMSKATAGTLATARGGTGRTDGKAVALATARTITLSGHTTGSATFDGSANITINTTTKSMTGATASAAGTLGFVPAPAAGAATRYLRCDGTWQVPPNTTYNAATQSANGLMSAADKKVVDGIPSTYVKLSGSRGSLAGNETAATLSGSQTISATSADTIVLTTSGATTLTFTAAANNVAAIKVLCLKASAATTLTVKTAVWSSGSAPTWGTAGKMMILVAHFIGGSVVLTVSYNNE